MRYQDMEEYLNEIETLSLIEKATLLIHDMSTKQRIVLLTAIASHAQEAIQANIEEML